MNADFFRYKTRFATLAFLFAYTWLHLNLTLIYGVSRLWHLIDFSTYPSLPQPLLMPGIVQLLQKYLPLTTAEIVFLVEFLLVTLFYLVLNALLGIEFKKDQARLLSWLFFLLLPLVTVINYCYTYHAAAPWFYSGDTASLLFICSGFFMCLQSRWYALYAIIFLATLNQPGSFLLVLLIPALHWQRGMASVLKPALIALSIYLITLFGFGLFSTRSIPWATISDSFMNNYHWLFAGTNSLLLLFCFAGLPLFWFAFYDYIPLNYRPIRFLALGYFLVLFTLSHFSQARIFEDIVLLMYLPICLALKRWLIKLPPLVQTNSYGSRYAVLALLGLIITLPLLLQGALF